MTESDDEQKQEKEEEDIKVMNKVWDEAPAYREVSGQMNMELFRSYIRWRQGYEIPCEKEKAKEPPKKTARVTRAWGVDKDSHMEINTRVEKKTRAKREP